MVLLQIIWFSSRSAVSDSESVPREQQILGSNKRLISDTGHFTHTRERERERERETLLYSIYKHFRTVKREKEREGRERERERKREREKEREGDGEKERKKEQNKEGGREKEEEKERERKKEIEKRDKDTGGRWRERERKRAGERGGKRDELNKQQRAFVKVTSVNHAAQLASYKVAHRIALCKKPHTIAEELILPAAIDMVSCLIDEKSAQKLKCIPLSNDTVGRRIVDISNDIEEQLIEAIRQSKYALQVDEATVNNKDCLLIAYVRFIAQDALSEEFLFCTNVTGRATADQLFQIINDYLSKHKIKWEDCVGICTDGARSMAGHKTGLRALIQRVSPNAQWTHCVIHREALASKQLSSELSETLTDVVSAVNYIKRVP
ncbi:hypothetical protein WMY93_002026 [Mugilogobius chulae]|uniref:DUF4371 domain-containing protein n=1 Tax=Mugilogobius chulae TaxID=88201 RepID=A0AAW0PUP4_9GOBI